MFLAMFLISATNPLGALIKIYGVDVNFDYDSLSALAAVVREGSFEAASRALKVTQSAVSQRIKQLEDKVGTVLIIRGRPCVPTETGLQLCQHVEQVNLLQHELLDRMGTLAGSTRKSAATIRIAVNSDSLATWFPDVMKRAADELNLRFEIIPDDQEYTEQALRSGEALAVVTVNSKPVTGCRRISLGAMEYMAIASPEFMAKHIKGKLTLPKLRDAPTITFDRKDTLPEQWMELAFGESFTPNAHMVPSYEGYLLSCVNGAGWGMMPTVTVQPFLDSGELIELVPGKRINISLHWQSSSQSSEILRLLAEVVAEETRTLLVPDSFRVA